MNFHISDWLPWSERDRLPAEPGVYLIAKGRADEVVYIGMTCGADGLRGRIAAFHRSATKGLPGHAGGVTYNTHFGDDVADLFVAVHVPVTIRPDTQIIGAYVLYVERRAIWEYVERVGKLPPCNVE